MANIPRTHLRLATRSFAVACYSAFIYMHMYVCSSTIVEEERMSAVLLIPARVQGCERGRAAAELSSIRERRGREERGEGGRHETNPLTTHPNHLAPRLSSKVAVSYALYPRYEQFPSACWLARARRCRIKGDRRKKLRRRAHCVRTYVDRWVGYVDRFAASQIGGRVPRSEKDKGHDAGER